MSFMSWCVSISLTVENALSIAHCDDDVTSMLASKACVKNTNLFVKMLRSSSIYSTLNRHQQSFYIPFYSWLIDHIYVKYTELYTSCCTSCAAFVVGIITYSIYELTLIYRYTTVIEATTKIWKVTWIFYIEWFIGHNHRCAISIYLWSAARQQGLYRNKYCIRTARLLCRALYASCIDIVWHETFHVYLNLLLLYKTMIMTRTLLESMPLRNEYCVQPYTPVPVQSHDTWHKRGSSKCLCKSTALDGESDETTWSGREEVIDSYPTKPD
jgi:hypothetical protein